MNTVIDIILALMLEDIDNSLFIMFCAVRVLSDSNSIN